MFFFSSPFISYVCLLYRATWSNQKVVAKVLYFLIESFKKIPILWTNRASFALFFYAIWSLFNSSIYIMFSVSLSICYRVNSQRSIWANITMKVWLASLTIIQCSASYFRSVTLPLPSPSPSKERFLTLLLWFHGKQKRAENLIFSEVYVCPQSSKRKEKLSKSME